MAEGIPEPFQGKSGTLGNAHNMPAVWNGCAAGVDSALWIDGNGCGMCEYNTGCADGGKSFSIRDNTGSHRSSGIVTGSADHDGASGKPCAGCGSWRDASGYFAGFKNRGKQGRIDVQCLANFLAPAAVGDIQQLHTGCVGNICCKDTG